jgi:monoterpene epsilon-lactone hydrolase
MRSSADKKVTMPSFTARLIRGGLRRGMKPYRVDGDFVRAMRRKANGGMAVTIVNRRVTCRTLRPGELGEARGERVSVPGARRHVLYLHGGYYIAGRPKPYRNLAGRLAHGLDADVVLIDYRLAPEHPYPAAVDDAATAYRAMLDSGIDPASTAVVGDSAGGGLALAMLLKAKADGVPLPRAAVVFSPWTDLTCSSPIVDANDDADDMLSAAALRRASECYAGSHDRSDPGLSPIFGDLAGLPPLFVTVDSSETLLDDSLRLVEGIRDAGGRVELRRSSGLFHVWPMLVPYLPEARSTVSEVIAFLDAELA